MNATDRAVLLSGESLSLTFQGELNTGRKTRRRPIIVAVRKRDMPFGGRIYPQRGVLNAWINLPPVHFREVLIMAMSGALATIELTTAKLQRDTGDISDVRFATSQVQNTHEPSGMRKGSREARLHSCTGRS
jgi:hypothetical protein